ncbi:hypothetical protein [Candidatus Protochlamydia naegleriophila]|nr:hypothetical protein [Candidatus Protochlamydia naegleriophila]
MTNTATHLTAKFHLFHLFSPEERTFSSAKAKKPAVHTAIDLELGRNHE